ncbi:MAG: transpeptidase family protein [Bacteroidaceae bacterium]|nr:transpeptidase family protein [Bacteroidaceae bacterium]
MSSIFDRKKIIPRFKWIALALVVLAAIVLIKAGYIAITEKEYWQKVASQLHKEGVETKPVRGNILSCDGRLMASSLPEYVLRMDFKAVKNAGNDSLLLEKMDSICTGLHEIFPERSAEEFKQVLLEGREREARNWKIWNRHVSHHIYTQVRKLPIFRMNPNRGGFHADEFNARQHPHGSLAVRTIGSLYGAKDSAKCGLELYYDSILRGKKGLINRQKVMNKYLNISVKEPVDGADVVTTLDIEMQDLAERSLLAELKDRNADVGVAIVMEVATGDIKAIVNMSKTDEKNPDCRTYAEMKNNACSDLLEPGSVFKTASMMVALDDGMCDTNYVVATGNGVRDMYGAKMRDHNWSRGGCGTINMVKIMEKSSNIGVSVIINNFYSRQPEKYVEGLYRLGLHDDLRLPIVGYATPKIRMPQKNGRGNYTNWPATTIPWMSIGYETQIPPISTVTFYNAIANGGKMMRPRFVKEIRKDGEVIQSFPPEVMREQIAKPSTVEKITKVLTSVVSRGTGKKAGSKAFAVAGKTGTAQISKGKAGYKSGAMHYLISFCGFFPADNPEYTCIVCMQKSGAASGGLMCGKVFHEISEGIMASKVKSDPRDAVEDNEPSTPIVKNGNIGAADYVLNRLKINTDSDVYQDGAKPQKSLWGACTSNPNGVVLKRDDNPTDRNTVPDVSGMGARDAVYLLESCGLKVKINGRGKVQSQSLTAGGKVKKGAVCHIILG